LSHCGQGERKGSSFRDFVKTSFIDDLLLFVYYFGLKLNEITQESHAYRKLKGAAVHQKSRSQEEGDLPIVNVKERWFFI